MTSTNGVLFLLGPQWCNLTRLNCRFRPQIPFLEGLISIRDCLDGGSEESPFLQLNRVGPKDYEFSEVYFSGDRGKSRKFSNFPLISSWLLFFIL